MNKHLLTAGLLLAVFSQVALANEESIGNATNDEPASLEAGDTLAFDTRSCIAMYHSISDGGHRWNIDARNGCGRTLNCEVTLNLRTSTGLTTVGRCNPTVPNGNTRVCSVYNGSLTWTSVINGSFRCK